jgi:Fic family protein/DNA-binding XRE family transcriptional regulator
MQNASTLLEVILRASGLTQERLAVRLGVSFATVNAWINGRSAPRPAALAGIERLYAEFLGADTVDAAALADCKKKALECRMTARQLLRDDALLRRLTSEMTYHTNTIEGSTMTQADVETVLFDHGVLRNRSAIEQREAINHQVALNALLDRLAADGEAFRIDEDLVLQTHARLMHGIQTDAGTYRRHGVRILGSRTVPSNPASIPQKLRRWCDAANAATDDPVALLAGTHAAFEQIHPFGDGNGRAGRLMMLARALAFGLTPPVIEKERKQAYYKYLEFCQVKGSPAFLELFIAQEIVCTSAKLGTSRPMAE